MAVAVTVNSPIGADPGAGIDSTKDSLIVEGALTLSGNYGTLGSHGDVLSFANDKVKSSYPPKVVQIYQEPTAGVAPIAYRFMYARGTTQLNGLLIVLDNTGAEPTGGAAYPGPLTAAGANIRFRAEFAKNV